MTVTASARRVVWFSCGAASAVAAKLATEKYMNCEVVYCDTLSAEHPDNARFFKDVERWIDRPITVLKSTVYESVDAVFTRRRYMSGVAGAACTTAMKKVPRVEWQRIDDIHIFGYTVEEERRAERFEDNNKSLLVEWLLVNEGITKRECLLRLENACIALPVMYSLGFDHNNCLGCVKSASSGYWNRTRLLFPDVFKRRCEQSRAIGVRLVRLGKSRIFLDELPPDDNAPDDDIDCGPVCQIPVQE